jgi:hypothetical protein
MLVQLLYHHLQEKIEHQVDDFHLIDKIHQMLMNIELVHKIDMHV